MTTNVIIMGAAGKDFHVFNTCYRNNPDYNIIAFTATQIPDIDGRKYPAQLAGKLYPNGITIYPESQLVKLIKEFSVKEVVFAYSDVSYKYIDGHRKAVENAGAVFKLADVSRTMLKSSKPVIAICAVRTGAGKSPVTRKVASIVKKLNKNVGVVRHPMPYGDLVKQEVQKFTSLADMEEQHCTIEEMEEYEPHINNGFSVYAGVDYEKILRKVEKENDIVLWDGGNNDTPFFKPILHITVADPHRPGHEVDYYPGSVNFEMADVILVNKVDSAAKENINIVLKNAKKINPKATVIQAKCNIIVTDPGAIKGKRVLAVEDGPTVTHGEMGFGAAFLAAKKYGAKEIVKPEKFAVGTIKKSYEKYPLTKDVLPAVGYGKTQMKDLEKTINNCECDLVLMGTPVDLGRLLKINKPVIRVGYEIEEIGKPDLKDVILSKLS